VGKYRLRLDELLAGRDRLVEHRPRVALDGPVVPADFVGELLKLGAAAEPGGGA
jgi:hypothetical protein